MPVVAVNIAPAVLADIHALVARGVYASPEQFLEIAAFNQIALERGARADDLQTRAQTAQRPAQEPTTAPFLPKKGRREGPPTTKPSRRKPSGAPNLLEAVVAFRLPNTPPSPPKTRAAEPRPITERLWGQVNRLFPMKLVCRWLHAHGAIALASTAPRLGEAAAVLGSALEALDAAAGRKREDLLATGLPRAGNVTSMERFLSQYLARTTRAGDIYPGAVTHYALVQFDADVPVLTDRGLEFARLSNPILEAAPPETTDSLNAEEREFLTQQVMQFVPAEQRDFAVVVRSIAGGAATPDDLMAAVRDSFPHEWSEVMARTHLSGLVARLSDLGALRREWEGRHVTYRLTPSSRSFTHAPEK